MKRSYSYSKRSLLDRCPRAYYYEYYAAAKAVPTEPDSKKVIRELKKLTNCHMVAGQVLHRMIAAWFRNGLEWSRDWLVDTAIGSFDRTVAYSRDPAGNAAMMQEPYPPSMLLEFHYGEPCADETASQVRGRLSGALGSLFDVAEVASLSRTLAAAGAEPERRIAGLALEGYTVMGQVDLVAHQQGEAQIVDWKMGAAEYGYDSLQLFIYGWWACETYRAEPTKVAVRRVFLGDGTVEEPSVLSPSCLDTGRARLLQDIELMEELHPYGTNGDEGAFSKCDKEGICRACKYRQVCRSSASATGSRPTYDLFGEPLTAS